MKTFLIKSIHDVFVDDFNEGLLDACNIYTMEKTIDAEDYKSAVNDYFGNHLYFNLDINNCEVFEGRLETSCLVDSDNSQPTETEVEKWQRRKQTLYCNQISIEVFEVNKITELS